MSYELETGSEAYREACRLEALKQHIKANYTKPVTPPKVPTAMSSPAEHRHKFPWDAPESIDDQERVIGGITHKWGGKVLGWVPSKTTRLDTLDKLMKANPMKPEASPKVSSEKEGVILTQIGGSHYTKMKIQPIEYVLANGLTFIEGNVIKYVSRWKDKGGVEDLKKARHMLDLLIAHEEAKGV